MDITEKKILAQLHLLPEYLKQEILRYITFLQQNQHSEKIPKKRVFGSAKGKYILSDDFNDPLEDFKEYM